VQRVTESSVTVNGDVIGEIGPGVTVLLGVEADDSENDADQLVKKIAQLRIFNDVEGKFNRSLEDVGGAVLVVSQFTLHGDARKGNRPSFVRAARPEQAIPLYERVVQGFRDRGIPVKAGKFGAHMEVRILNDGPVTILIDTKKLF
jgi:D-tyrosyl-tRNA(Tyr) deacylase